MEQVKSVVTIVKDVTILGELENGIKRGVELYDAQESKLFTLVVNPITINIVLENIGESLGPENESLSRKIIERLLQTSSTLDGKELDALIFVYSINGNFEAILTFAISEGRIAII